MYLVWEFSIPRSPMNSIRDSTTTPSVVPGTMKAVMPPLRPSLRGTLASTTMTSATVPLVVHSLRPLRR